MKDKLKKKLEEARQKAADTAASLKKATEDLKGLNAAVQSAQESFKGLREEGLGAAARRASQNLGDRLGAAGAKVNKTMHSALSELKSVAEMMKDFREAFNDLGETLNGLMGRHKKKYKDMSPGEQNEVEREATDAVARAVDQVLVPHLGPDEAALDRESMAVVRRSVRESLRRDVIASIRANGGINPSDLQTIAEDTTKVALGVIHPVKPPVPRRPVLKPKDTTTAPAVTGESTLEQRLMANMSPEQRELFMRRRELQKSVGSVDPKKMTKPTSTVGAKPAPAKAAPGHVLELALRDALNARRQQLERTTPKGGDKPTRPRSGSSGGWSS
jgi:hypothetical protein